MHFEVLEPLWILHAYIDRQSIKHKTYPEKSCKTSEEV